MLANYPEKFPTGADPFGKTKRFWAAWGFRLLGGLAGCAVYLYFYQQGDLLQGFADAGRLAESAKADPIRYLDFWWRSSPARFPDLYALLSDDNPRAVLMVKWLSLASLLTFNNLWLSSLLFSSFAFSGCWAACVQIGRFFPQLYGSAQVGFLYWPSVVFWGSGLFKESLLMGCLGWLIAIWLRWIDGEKFEKPGFIWLSALAFLALAYLLVALKYYYAAALFPIMFALTASVKGRWKGKSQPTLFFVATLLLLTLPATGLHPNLQPSALLEAIVTNNLKMAMETSDPNNLLNFKELSPNFYSMLRNLPVAFWEGLARPYPWEPGHLLKKLAGLEHLALLGLLAFGLREVRREWPSLSESSRIWLIGGLLYCLLLSILLAYSAPNLGNLVRYKIGFLPILVTLLGKRIFSHRSFTIHPLNRP